VEYTRRLFDAPLPLLGAFAGRTGAHPLDADGWRTLVGALPPAAATAQPTPGQAAAEPTAAGPAPQRWLVSVALPIEATSRAEAVRAFWAYVMRLGPRELPAYVAPSGDELATQAYLLDTETNLDPEEDG
jgi:hypothetical protein